MTPEDAEPFYRHAMWIDGGQGWPWVSASGIQGLKRLRIEPVALKSTPSSDTFSVRWLGSIQPEHSATYTFYGSSDYGLRLWVGDQLLLDNSTQLRRGEMGELSAAIPLEAGQTVPIRLEYLPPKQRQAGESATFALLWSCDAMPKSSIPAARLLCVDGQPGGLTGMYHATAAHTGPAALQIDSELRFDWGQALPAVLQPLARPIPLEARPFTVALTFAEPDGLSPGQRVFSVRMQGQPVLTDFDVAREAGGANRGVVREFTGVLIHEALELEFAASTGHPALLCGVELIEEPAEGERSDSR
jgi:hypothetical protein